MSNLTFRKKTYFYLPHIKGVFNKAVRSGKSFKVRSNFPKLGQILPNLTAFCKKKVQKFQSLSTVETETEYRLALEVQKLVRKYRSKLVKFGPFLLLFCCNFDRYRQFSKVLILFWTYLRHRRFSIFVSIFNIFDKSRMKDEGWINEGWNTFCLAIFESWRK